ncbi:hypothetical protein GCM10023331_30340 [Algivirga pacifica]|uniref:Peptidase S74 domain-containing protein n=2 Tax=Algivirga pacifica TaxID=1162670 RepID=A0ABP9DG27_9BACT
MGGTLSVTGASSFTDVSVSGTMDLSDINTSGDLSVEGELSVEGTSNFTDVSSSGISSLSTVSISGSSSIGGDLSVAGVTTLSTLSLNNKLIMSDDIQLGENSDGKMASILLKKPEVEGEKYTKITANEGHIFTIDSDIASSSNNEVFYIRENGDAVLQGKLESKAIKVTTSPGADFVFEEDYVLRPLSEVEEFIIKNKHLPEIAPAKQMEEKGLDMSAFQIQLLQKVEELTLYAIELEKKNKALTERMEQLEKLEKRLEALEKKN